MQIGCDLPGARWAVQAAACVRPRSPASRCTPTRRRDTPGAGTLDEALAEIEALARTHDKVRAVGETGLDHFRTGPDERAAQVASFRIDLAKRLDKTLVIHDRDDEECSRSSMKGAPERWVMHCFSGDEGSPRRCLDRGATSASPGP